ncbi:MAG TPA: citrate synthase family protein [Stellaceae bacterium]|nr:citrate synthase family protein [Stellaceae bacterium]
MHRELLTAREAAERLGVKLETLYAYVSRGRLRSVAVPGSRERRYQAEDIDAARAARGAAKAGTAPAAEPATVVASSISLIEGGRLYYRGRDVLRLSDAATLEEIAALLWDAPELEKFCPGPQSSTDAAAADRTRGEPPAADLIAHCQIRLAEMAERDRQAPDLTRAGVIRSGRDIVAELVACSGGGTGLAPAHHLLASGWGLDAAGSDILRRCLVLLADHELSASSFVARCVASTGAVPAAAVSAALGALSGRRHGGAALRAAVLLQELARHGDPLIAAAERLARGEVLPGIGHPLYPDGDPRAVAILYAISARTPQARRFVGWRPNVDFALAVATTALALPPMAALALLMIGRSVGWIAHAIEQYESDIPIRPRARYTGLRPEGAPG